MSTILDEIFAHKRLEVAARKREIPLAEMRRFAELSAPPLDFVNALRKASGARGIPALIAEVKKASPSKGLLTAHFDPLELARTYAEMARPPSVC